MGSGIRYTDEFKQQVVKHSYSVPDVSKRLGISSKSLYDLTKKFSQSPKIRVKEADLQAENAKLKRELRRTELERNILNESDGVLGCRNGHICSKHCWLGHGNQNED